MPLSSSFFPLRKIKKLWNDIEPREYQRKIKPAGLAQAFMIAFANGLPGLRAVARRAGDLAGTANHSALSHALGRDSSVHFVEAVLKELEPRYAPGKNDIVAIDSMPITIPATYRHNCELINRWTAGGGLLWELNLTARRGSNPVRLLNIVEGARGDATLIKDAELIANGPIYLMDRGFYAIDHVARWSDEGVRFVVRAKSRLLRYDVVKSVGRARWIMGAKRHRRLRIKEDVVVRLGRRDRKIRPLTRMVRALLPTGEELIIVSDMLKEKAERLLSLYRRRWQIERFHFFLKETLGLAHLYSFRRHGVMFLTLVSLLFCVLLFLESPRSRTDQQCVDVLRLLLQELRESLGLFHHWRSNTIGSSQIRRKKKPNP